MIIYKLTNITNGKQYIGQSINTWKQRKAGYNTCISSKHNNQRIVKALRKYGWNKFNVEIIATAKTTQKLNELEEYYIKKFNTINEGYNIATGGDNKIYSETHKQILKKSWTYERRKNASERMKEQNKKTKGLREKNISLGLKDYYREFKQTDEFWEKNKKLQKGKEKWRAKNPVMTTRKYILEDREGVEMEIVNLKEWCRKKESPDYANLLGNFKKQKGWAKGWRIKKKLDKVKPQRSNK